MYEPVKSSTFADTREWGHVSVQSGTASLGGARPRRRNSDDIIPVLQIERVAPGAVEQLHEIIRQCGQDMKQRLGLRHWVPPYPLTDLRQDAVERAVYAVRADGRAVATFTVGTSVPRRNWDGLRSVAPGTWIDLDARALYLNRLAVLPELQGTGIGRCCLDTIEGLAREAACATVRLDACAANAGLLQFYHRAGYERRGYARARGYTFVLFEKRIRRGVAAAR